MFGLIRLMIFKHRWREKNKNNFTVAKNLFPIDSVNVGVASYGGINVLDFGCQYKLDIDRKSVV